MRYLSLKLKTNVNRTKKLHLNHFSLTLPGKYIFLKTHLSTKNTSFNTHRWNWRADQDFLTDIQSDKITDWNDALRMQR